MIGPQDKTQNSVFDEGKLPVCIIHVLGAPSPQNTVGHDVTIENIEFPSSEFPDKFPRGEK